MNALTKTSRRGMATSCRKIEFYYDVISPYSWYAFEIMERYQKRWNLDIIYKPVLLGGIFKATGNAAPALVPARGKALAMDIKRCTKYYKVPLHDMNFADLVTKGSMPPMRFLTAIQMNNPKHLVNVSRQFWMKRFNSNEDFTPVEGLKDVAAKAGMNAAEIETILSKIATSEVKEKLKQTTNEAVEKGAYGVPTYVTEVDGKNEMFFGADRFPLLAQTIGEEWAGPDPELTSKL